MGTDHSHGVSMTGTTKVHSPQMVNDWQMDSGRKVESAILKADVSCTSTEIDMDGVGTSKKQVSLGLSIEYCFIA